MEPVKCKIIRVPSPELVMALAVMAQIDDQYGRGELSYAEYQEAQREIGLGAILETE